MGIVLTNVVLVSPLEANLKVMVLCNDRVELLEQFIRLLCVQFVDEFGEGAESEYTLPTSDGVGSDNRVYGYEFFAHVQRTTTLFLVYLDLLRIGSCGFGETFAGECSCKAFEELPVGRRESVVNLVPGCPYSITTSLWELSQA